MIKVTQKQKPKLSISLTYIPNAVIKKLCNFDAWWRS